MKPFIFFLFTFFTTCHLAGCKKKCSVLRDHPLSAFMYLEPNSDRIKLGDTLRLKIFIPYKSLRLDNNELINVESSSLSTSGLWFLTYKSIVNGIPEVNGNKPTIIPIKGTYTTFNDVSVRVSYVKDVDGFKFEAFVIPKEKGLAFLANFKAEGWMNGKCEFNTFNPIIGSQNNNHMLLRNFYGTSANDPIPENHYFVWVE